MSNFHERIEGHTVLAGISTAAGGTTNFHISDAPGQDSAARTRKAFSTVPFAPDTDFVDRPEILAWVRDKCARPGARAALVGLGGVGKSQLAIQYAHNVRDAAPQTFVFWVHASTRARFEEAYRGIADRLHLPGRNDAKADVLQLVSDWLRDETNGQWFIVLDNADDMATFFPSQKIQQDKLDKTLPVSLASHLPQSRNGSILITSRNRDAANRLAGGYNNTKEVLAMDVGEGLQLLRKKIPTASIEDDAAGSLVRALDCMPLAITQAAAYISRGARMTIARYLKEFRANSKKKESLLNWDAGDLRRDESASNSVVTAWQMSFERIRQERPSATDLLSLMSCFNPQGIPEWVLRQHNRRMTKGCEEDVADSAFDEDFDLLYAYSLVTITAETAMCEMHPLVQYCTQVWLSTSSDPKNWDRAFLELMAREFPQPDFENWANCQQLLPHCDSLYNIELFDVELLKRWASLFNKVAWYMKEALGKYDEAEKLYRQVLEGTNEALGEQHPNTLAVLGSLASVLQQRGELNESEVLQRRALEGKKKELGDQHPETLTSLSNLAVVMEKQGKYDEAETLYRQTLNMNNLAVVMEKQGKYDEAETLHRQALEVRKNELGDQHPDTLFSISNLAYLLHQRKRYEEATELYQQACDGLEQQLGSQHPDTVWCCKHFLAMQEEMKQASSSLNLTSQYEEAAELSEQASNVLGHQLTSQHPEIVEFRENSAVIQEEAEQDADSSDEDFLDNFASLDVTSESVDSENKNSKGADSR